MGTCCSCRNDKPEIKDEFTVKKQLVYQRTMDSNHLLSLTQENQFQSSEFYALNLSRLITSNPELHIEAIGLETIWNILRTYRNDFTSTDYIIYDLRPKVKRKENFLKKFKCINYTISEMEQFPENKLLQIAKYLLNKKVIIINQEEDIDLCDRFIKLVLNNYFKVNSILILNTILDADVQQESKWQLYSRMDDRWFIYYPYVLLAIKSYSYLKSMTYIFIDKNKGDNDNDYTAPLDSISSSSENNRYEQFIMNMNVKVILHLTREGSKEEQVNQALLPTGVTIIKLDLTSSLKSNKRVFQIIEIIKSHLLSQGSLLILYDNKDSSISEVIVVEWIINLLNQLTHYTLSQIRKIINTSCYFLIENINAILKTIDNNRLIDVGLEMRSLSEVNEKFDIYLSRLKNQTNSFSKFKAICSIMEKIVLNILTHPSNSVYYNIKCESNTFKVNISINEYAKMAFEIFGFKLNKGVDGDYYNLDIETDLDWLRQIYFCFVHSVKRIVVKENDNCECDAMISSENE